MLWIEGCFELKGALSPLKSGGFVTCFGWNPLPQPKGVEGCSIVTKSRWIRNVIWLGPQAPKVLDPMAKHISYLSTCCASLFYKCTSDGPVALRPSSTPYITPGMDFSSGKGVVRGRRGGSSWNLPRTCGVAAVQQVVRAHHASRA